MSGGSGLRVAKLTHRFGRCGYKWWWVIFVWPILKCTSGSLFHGWTDFFVTMNFAGWQGESGKFIAVGISSD